MVCQDFSIHDFLLEQQRVGITLAVITAALSRQLRYCLLCHPENVFLAGWQVMYGGTYPRKQTQKLPQEAGGAVMCLLGAGPAWCFPPLVTGKMYTLMAAKSVTGTEPP